VLAAPSAHALSLAQVRATLRHESARLGRSSGAYVRDLDAGRTLFSRRAWTRRVPASNTKLLVAGAALLRYGPAGHLTTSVRSASLPDAAGVIHGPLALVGGGDPYLDDVGLEALAAQVAAAGVRRVTGGIVGDPTFLDDRVGSYDSGFAFDWDLGGRLSGLVVDEGRQKDPPLHAASDFRKALLAAHVRVGGRSSTGSLPDATHTLATFDSDVQGIAARLNPPSDNYAAELLLKDLGASFGAAGSTAAGAEVVRSTLAELGVKVTIVDGSGLSRSDRVSPAMVVRLLDRMAPDGRLASTLAVAGRTGTLADRMRRGRVREHCRAKTGTLNGVSALSGYCDLVGGHTVAYSLLENGVCSSCAKRIEDRMVRAIARYRPAR
jgi:D-alanyl-D-alanine carboxypeptidase/D-alanyl-D-alanine-endopeptidase (penicillin-binding protein 4)